MAEDPLSLIGAVIVTYASSDQIEGCLSTLPIERLGAVVVVDNDSPDGTADRVAGLALPGVVLERSPRNAGFGAACNQGRQLLPALPFVLFVNPDARAGEAALERLVEYMLSHPQCASAAPRLFRGGEALTSAGDPASLWTELGMVLPPRLFAWLPKRHLPPDFDRSGAVGYVEGACFLVRREVLDLVGGFDERFFLFFEELDLAHRFRSAGCTVDLVADAVVDHAQAASRASLQDNGRAELYASAARYLSKWHGQRRARLFAVAAHAGWRLQHLRGLVSDAEHRQRRARLRDAFEGAASGPGR